MDCDGLCHVVSISSKWLYQEDECTYFWVLKCCLVVSFLFVQSAATDWYGSTQWITSQHIYQCNHTVLPRHSYKWKQSIPYKRASAAVKGRCHPCPGGIWNIVLVRPLSHYSGGGLYHRSATIQAQRKRRGKLPLIIGSQNVWCCRVVIFYRKSSAWKPFKSNIGSSKQAAYRHPLPSWEHLFMGREKAVRKRESSGFQAAKPTVEDI